MSNQQFHVKFFNSRKELFPSVFDVLEKNDHIFLSGTKKMNTPLWHTVVRGTVLALNKEKNELKLDMAEREDFFDAQKRVEFQATRTTIKKQKLSYHHGFRIDQERIFTNIVDLVNDFGLKIHPMSYAVPVEKRYTFPAEMFLEVAQPGDYVMVWSEPDKIQKNFLHYPVQGWLWSKNIETMEIEFIHPPRMDIQKFSCNPSSRKLMGFGFYRKLVYQLSDLSIKD